MTDELADFDTLETISALDMVAAASPQRRRAWELEAFSGVRVCSVTAANVDHPMVNRVIASTALDARELRQEVTPALQRLQQRGIHRYLVQLAAPAPESWLAGHDLAPVRNWVRAARGNAAPPRAGCDYDIVRVGPARAPEVARLVAATHDLPAAAGELVASIVGRAGWHVYAALDDGDIVAAGTLFVSGEQGCLLMAGTLPSHRGRGAQSALIARRIQVAIDLGCRSLTVTTGEAVAGEPQHSYRNLRRHGFAPVATIFNYAPRGLTRLGQSSETQNRGVCHDGSTRDGARLVRRPCA